MQDIDLIVISPDEGSLDAAVQRGIDIQRGVRVQLHRVVGRALATDRCRWETIARARNQGKQRGHTPWLMFLDDDVVLDADCLRRLVEQLWQNRQFGALAADYLRENRTGQIPVHVGMGATMFRRDALHGITFRWRPARCECQCCCDDLRRQGYAIGYSRTAGARHQRKDRRATEPDHSSSPQHSQHAALSAAPPAHILAAFDRNHFDLFRHQFLVSLRNAGNREPVTAVAIGLYPSQERALRRLPDVNLMSLPPRGEPAPIRRLQSFQRAIASFPEDMPLAYWDAGDVLFQGRLTKLWRTIKQYPRQLLVVREPFAHPQNRALAGWISRIRDPKPRQRAFDLLTHRMFLNSGFAAGTVSVLRSYLENARQVLVSTPLRGPAIWADQLAMNLYCHNHEGAWREVEEGWNYCLCGRRPDSYQIAANGHLQDRRGVPVYVVHGNARSIQPAYRLHHYRHNRLLRSRA